MKNTFLCICNNNDIYCKDRHPAWQCLHKFDQEELLLDIYLCRKLHSDPCEHHSIVMVEKEDD